MKNQNDIPLMSPKVDFVFKRIFGNPEMPEILISFLNAVFDCSGNDKIVTVSIQNPNIDKKCINDKYSILDVRAKANDNTIVDIEIQIANNSDMVKRTVYYLSKLIEEQIFEGDDYTKLIKSVTINIVNFVVVQNDRVHNSFMFKEIDTNEILTDVAQIHFLELPKLNKNGKIGNELLKDWLLFIENPEGKEVSMIAEKIPEINMAAEQLKVLSHDSQARIEYEQRQKSLHEKVSSLNFARKEGEKKSLLRQMKRKFNIGQSEENIIVLCVDNDLIEQALDMIIDNAEKDEILNLFRH
ncbi:MAG: hypothetical protein A2015_14340 [Spirochaetes bacterium GWF1_31_7]|nr:MAG: hypothetical protein A2Y30_03410 [Spirochaetes bacterium GWE1_32_154]OHD45457.1 MAG: hypothetical protein A2Y29_01410 [Spirochaetes bacterium GWE2_31_10]OHD50580.1 MAG: hypothetical protein A2015_14340 [Spirochaetes bacterium GWF1_31_7]HBD94566.1 hypothetical protein [Spirochaetia bacterium]HBI36541.1 hypothetical protein [Spirochaetia bacterium]